MMMMISRRKQDAEWDGKHHEIRSSAVLTRSLCALSAFSAFSALTFSALLSAPLLFSLSAVSATWSDSESESQASSELGAAAAVEASAYSSLENLLPVSEELTPLEKHLAETYETSEDMHSMLEMQHEQIMMETAAQAAHDEADDAAEEAEDAEAAADESGEAVFLETSADVSADSEWSADDDAQLSEVIPGVGEIDPLVTEFLSKTARRSESAELRALEEGTLAFDANGNDVLLEHSAASGTEISDDIDAAIRNRVAQKLHTETSYQKPETVETLEQTKAPAAKEEAQPTALVETQSQTEVDEHAAVDAEAEAAVAAALAHSAAADLKIHEEAEAAAAAHEQSAILMELSSAQAAGFSPESALAHKAESIGKMRSERVRANRLTNKRGVVPQGRGGGRTAVEAQNFGLYDERKAAEEARPMSAELVQALNADRTQRQGSARAFGLAPTPYCGTFPFCAQTPAPPQMAELPFDADPARRAAELAELDPLSHLPTKLADLKKDPRRFGAVFQNIYAANKHNEKNGQIKMQQQAEE